MLFYIFLVSVTNLCLGFAAARQLRRRCNSLAAASPQRGNSAVSHDAPGDTNITTASRSAAEPTAHGSHSGNNGDGNRPPTAEGETPAADNLNAGSVAVEKQLDRASAADDEFASELDALFV